MRNVQVTNIPAFQLKNQEGKYFPEQNNFIGQDGESFILCLQYFTGHGIVLTSLGSKNLQENWIRQIPPYP